MLESLFGKLKSLEHDQSKSGFTGLVLSLGAMVTRLTPESIAEALDRVRVTRRERLVCQEVREDGAVAAEAALRARQAQQK